MLSSSFTVKESADRLIILLDRLQMAVYARVNRKDESRWWGVVSRPMECILFDRPQLSTPIIEKDPILAFYFPMKIIIWEDNGCRVAFRDLTTMLRKYDPASEIAQWPNLCADITRALEK